MLATAPVIAVVTEYVDDLDVPVVVDPVMVAATGDRLLAPDAENVYEDLLAHAALTTPNADEAEVLTGLNSRITRGQSRPGKHCLKPASMPRSSRVGTSLLTESEMYFVTADDVKTYEHPRVDTDATHGSGCTLASAITTRLAHDEPLADAVDAGVSFIERAVRYHLDVGEGPGSVHHMVALRERAARQRTQEDVEGIVRQFVEGDVSRLVPEVG